MRHRIAVEILDTELAYVENLRQLNKVSFFVVNIVLYVLQPHVVVMLVTVE